MAVRKQGDTWRYRRRVRLPNGLRVRIDGSAKRYNLSNTKSGALEAEQQHIAEVTRPGKPVGGLCGITMQALGDLAIESSSMKNSPGTTDWKRDMLRLHILPAIGNLDVSAVDFAAIESLKPTLLAKGLVAKSVNNVLNVLSDMLTIARKRGLIETKPDVEMLKVTKAAFDYLEFDEADRLIAAADGEWRAMIIVGLRAGLRQGELLGLHWDDCDLRAGRILVRHSYVKGRMGPPKSGKMREVDMGEDIKATLQAQRHLRGPLVFCSPAGMPLPFSQCRSPLQRACKRAGLREISWHVLRHTFGSHLAMRGATPGAIQKLMGHASITTTMIYMHLSPHVTHDAVRLLDSTKTG